MNTNFLSDGDRVRAKVTVYDLPPSKDMKHADPGDTGVVVHTEPGVWPTVQFTKTGTMTCVTPDEVEKI